MADLKASGEGQQAVAEPAPPPTPPVKAGGPPAGDPPASAGAGRRKVLIPIAVLALLGLGGYFLWRNLRGPEVPPGVVALSGRIEGDEATASPKASGRILSIRVREGDRVTAGQVIAVLDDEQVRAREQAAQATLAQAEARVRLAKQQIAVLNEQLRESQLGVGQARQEAQGRVREAEAQVAAAEAQLAERQAALDLAQYDREAYTRLAKTGAVAERQAREATSTAAARAAAVAAAQRQVEAARAAVTTAQAGLTNPEIRSSQSSTVRQQILQQQAEIASAEADVNRTRAQLEEARANRQDLEVKAPFDGTIATRTAEPGEVVNAGTSIVTLLDLSKVYLRGFVPEGQIGRVRVGQTARVYLDSNANQPLEAVVSRVDPEAAFTPENTYFREDRVKQVVGVKLQLKGGTGYAKPGMPADGEILVEGTAWPERRARE